MSSDKGNLKFMDAKFSSPPSVHLTRDGAHIILTPPTSLVTASSPEYIFNLYALFSEAEEKAIKIDKSLAWLESIKSTAKDHHTKAEATTTSEVMTSMHNENKKRDAKNRLEIGDALKINSSLPIHKAIGPELTVAFASIGLRFGMPIITRSPIVAPVTAALIYGSLRFEDIWSQSRYSDSKNDPKNV